MPALIDFVPPPHRPLPIALVLALALLVPPLGARAADKAAPAKTDGNSITDNIRSLGQQISDPKTPDRIKGHEQDFEKNVKDSREQQRKGHPGELRATDATGMANDPKMGGQGATKGATKGATTSAPKPKTGGAKVKKDGGSTAAPAEATKAPAKAPSPPAATPAK